MKAYYKRALELYCQALEDGDIASARFATIADKIVKEFKYSRNKDTVRKNISRYISSNYDKSKTSRNKSKRKDKDSTPFVLSAWNSKGYMMDIDEYCSHYKLPRKDIKSYKLVSHTGTPFYNILFKENVIDNQVDIVEVFKSHVNSKHKAPKIAVDRTDYETVDRLIWSDVHIGMDASRDGLSIYASEWGEMPLMDRISRMMATVNLNKSSDTIIVDDLGDYMDGWDGETVRGGHKLPQNMTNEKAFDTAVKAKMFIADYLCSIYDKVLFNNICEDNHAGSFGYIVNSAFKFICEQKHKNANVHNHKKFLSWYTVGIHAFVITHGKDSRNLKFGFKPHLDAKQVEKIDQYLKNENIYKLAKYIQFDKGDSHQCLFDYCTSDDFDYMNYPAFSPSSEWVQTNFKKGRSGFAIQRIYKDINRKPIEVFWF